MNSEQDELLLSQLADGELPSDQVNELLLEVLGDAEKQKQLGQMLRLRKATVGWRRQQPTRPMTIVAERSSPSHRDAGVWRLGSLAFAAGVGGVLVLVGTWAGGWLSGVHQRDASRVAIQGSGTPPAAAQVTPEQMQQVAQVFALHESVTGPLAWYAADDQNIRLSAADGTATNHTPIAVQLKLASAGSNKAPRTLIIVCREQQPTAIELPPESAGQSGLRMVLAPQKVNGKVDVQYTIAVEGDARPEDNKTSQTILASLSGRRDVGLTETSLGQLALGDKLVNVEATAWPLPEDQP